LELTSDEVHDCKIALEFISKLPVPGYAVVDRDYDSKELRQIIRDRQSMPIIPRKK
jgi:MinD superfamily P-loop ATPase